MYFHSGNMGDSLFFIFAQMLVKCNGYVFLRKYAYPFLYVTFVYLRFLEVAKFLSGWTCGVQLGQKNYQGAYFLKMWSAVI